MLRRNDDNVNHLSYRRTLFITLMAMGVVYILWNVPALDFIVYPLRLFVTYVHEAGHSAMALLTGGEVVSFVVNSDGSGVARTAGGSRALILPAGYLGAAFFGATLFYLSNTVRRPRTIALVVGAILIVFTLMYSGVFASGEPLAFIIGILGGIALIAMGWKLSRDINLLVLNVLALMTGLNALLDLWFIVSSPNVSSENGVIRNDAAAFSREVASFLPASVWALIWTLIAVVMLGAAMYYSLIRPLLKDEGDKSDTSTI